LDSFVFFDDNPAEREFVRQALPEVEVVDVPPDPADYVRALYHGLWFESAAITEADRARVEQYRDERQRREAEQTAGSVEAYLESLKMVADVRPLDGADMDRAVQLLAKTNQFNLTSRRHTADIVRSMLTRPKSLGITLRLADRFGDAGLVALILGVPLEEASIPTLCLDTWLMSCRVIARTVEEFSINYVVARAKELGYQRLLGEFIPTAKNQLVADLYDRLGFIKQSEAAGGITRYILNLADYKAHPSPILSKGI
jgi:FkbH-like protein